MVCGDLYLERSRVAPSGERQEPVLIPELLARWMLEEVEAVGLLYQAEVIEYLRAKYGNAGTYLNSKGNLAIAKPILAAFKQLTGETVVWIRTARYWRKTPAPRWDRATASTSRMMRLAKR